MDLTTRVLEGELMDAPDLDAHLHHTALRALRRVNWLSGTARIVSGAILQELRRRATNRVRVLDLACGGGDVTLQIADRLRAAKVEADVEGWDRSPTAVEHARAAAKRFCSPDTAGQTSGETSVRFAVRDLFAAENDPLLEQAGEFDVIMCTLFLHHLSRGEAQSLLARMYTACNWLVIVDDLRRTWLGYRLAQLGCQLLTRSKIVHIDGPLSVRAAFTVDELLALSQESSLPEPQVSLHWPQRFLASWSRRQS